MGRVLVIDSSDEDKAIITKSLGSEFEVVIADSCDEAERLLVSKNFDLILLEPSLCGCDALDLCEHLKQEIRTQDVPVVFLSRKSDQDSRMHGFFSGADDYIVKPVDPLELAIRLRILVRNRRRYATQNVRFWNLMVNLVSQKVYHLQNGMEVELDLTPMEFKLFYFFVRNSGMTLPREKIIEEVWGRNLHVVPRTVNKHISVLRKKIGSTGSAIESIHGKGYRLTLAQAQKA